MQNYMDLTGKVAIITGAARVSVLQPFRRLLTAALPSRLTFIRTKPAPSCCESRSSTKVEEQSLSEPM